VKLQEEQSRLQPPQVLDLVSWGNYTFSREPFAKVSEDLLEFIEDHHAEAGQFKDEVPLDMDWNGMFHYESVGKLLSFAVRLKEGGAMLGYGVFILTPTLHAKSTMHAICDALYLRPEYRQGLLGIKFIDFCEAHVRQAGAAVVHLVMKTDPRMARVLERSGHRIYEVTYMKVL
jgi:GNAT superfamily N-acetyltransferase